ncbi:hypothetical protein DFH11DRAFT_1868163 [Phellopilus nigrolimitatus]|nr:hypothetical protein DFH11DRAFT_1868163 [Phellopilus nigrolimitatus]
MTSTAGVGASSHHAHAHPHGAPVLGAATGTACGAAAAAPPAPGAVTAPSALRFGFFGDAPVFPRAWQHPARPDLDVTAVQDLQARLRAPYPHPYPHPPATPSAASPQSTVSSGPAVKTSVPAPSRAPPRTATRKKSIDRNRRPCAHCSGSKRKCKVISTAPHLCERCRNHGLAECPPHISWTRRKASVYDSDGLSPLDADDRELSSRSASPPFLGASRSPLLFPATAENEKDAYGQTSPTQAWVQMQAQASHGMPHAESGHYDPCMPPADLATPHYAPQDVQVNAANLCQPMLPLCHVCQTPYDQLLLMNYLTAVAAASSPYEDMPVPNEFGQFSAPFERSY